MKALSEEVRDAMSPLQAIELLKEGNTRFVNNYKINRNLLQQMDETSDGQHPFAVILSCIDSRTGPELIFDLGLGDVFSVRIAGNIQNEDILGSMEFGCKVAGAKVVAVLGHTKCGAIKGACDQVEMGNLTTLLQRMKPALEDEKTETLNRTSSNADFVEKVATLNVHLTVRQILENSPILKQMIADSEIALIGGMYDIETGVIDFYEEDIITSETLGFVRFA